MSAEDRNADNLWTRADFARKAPGMDWSAFLDAAGLSRQQALVVWQPSAVAGVAALVRAQPLGAWLDYLRFRAIDEYADVLPGAVSEPTLALRNRSANTSALPRAQRALTATRLAMSGPIGRMYAERYFPAGQKARVGEITRNVIAAFRQRVAAATWLSAASRTKARAKLDAVYFGMGYPESWPNYSELSISPDDPAGNQRRVAAWNLRAALARLEGPADRTHWWIAPQDAGAILLFHENAYNFAAALLQPPKYDAAESDAANYGAIGAIVGHELSHTVDTLGADYDEAGRKARWWTADDLASYQSVTAPLVRQFAGYRPLPDVAVDGERTLVENLADLGGLNAAFDAYRQSLGDRASDKEYVRQQDRLFFLGFARSWRGKIRDDALRSQLATDSHAPETYRIATVRNLDAWYDAFDVVPADKLYLAPQDRVRIW
jgi:putative endopeptidase